MSEPKSNIPWPAWAAVSILVVFIPAYFTYKASVEKPYVPTESLVKVPAKTENTPTEKKVIEDEEPRPKIVPHNRDEELSQKLVGTWNDHSSANGINYDVTMTYKSNGSFTTETLVSNLSGPVSTIYFNGSWEIDNAYCTLIVTGSSDVRNIPIGSLVKNKIRSINNEELVYTDHTGSRRTAQRMN